MQEQEIKNLLKIKQELVDIEGQKIEQIKALEAEINSIHSMLDEISQLISTRSFTTAENMLPQSMDLEDAARKNPQYSDNLQYTQKIFSEDRNHLLVVLKFQENHIEIRFSNPGLTKITQARYIESFVKPSLVSLKKVEKNLTSSLSKSFYGENKYIDRINLENVDNFESFEFIVEKMEDFIKSLNITKE